MCLQVGLFNDAYPELALVAIGADEIAIRVYWKVVIYFNSSPGAIEIKLNDVLALWVVNRILILVLWIYVARN